VQYSCWNNSAQIRTWIEQQPYLLRGTYLHRKNSHFPRNYGSNDVHTSFAEQVWQEPGLVEALRQRWQYLLRQSICHPNSISLSLLLGPLMTRVLME